MPVISKFCGIVICMLFSRPMAAHFHAIYGEAELVVGLWPLKVLQGDAPPSVRQMVLDWATQHQQELLSDWHRCGFRLPLRPIEPLR
ncbi:MAG: DUF4160 domain-containing protein [Verrucomicrobia bacterium]|nr:DUF4160 domain-containing protein [Verrucomicrobiota bacterium]